MEFRKRNKTRIMKILHDLCQIAKIDNRMYEYIKPNKYDENKAWYFLDYENVLDIVYLEMVDHQQDAVSKLFCCSREDIKKKNLPMAWYVTEFSQPGDGALISPDKEFTGFIPDRINDVILSSKIKPVAKYQLLYRMFNDLIQQQGKYKENYEMISKTFDSLVEQRV